jgi:hypothetical protein
MVANKKIKAKRYAAVDTTKSNNSVNQDSYRSKTDNPSTPLDNTGKPTNYFTGGL